MKLKKRILSAALSFALVFSAPSFVFAEEVAENAESQAIPELTVKQGYDTVMQLISLMGLTEKTKNDIAKEVLIRLASENPEALSKVFNEIAKSIDEYSSYYTEEEYKAMQIDLTGKSGGIGITASVQGDYLEIVSVIPGGAADIAGLESGDKIVEVDGTDVTGAMAEKAVELVRGEIGQSVDVKVLRKNGEITAHTLVRVEITDVTVSATTIDDEIGYIRITHFSNITGGEFVTYLDEFKEKGIKKLIIDLRNNGGGTLEGALGVANSILDKDEVIVSFKGKMEGDETTYKDEEDSIYDFDIAVLVNEYTASASEVVTAAIVENNHGISIGNQTYGKATVQGFYPIGGINGVLKMTVNAYFTPLGNSINKVGLAPTETVTNTIKIYEPDELDNFTYKTKPQLGDTDDNVLIAKKLLSMLNYDISDEESNVFDEKLDIAVREFQAENDLFPYGVLDMTTQTYIRNKVLDSKFLDDKQLDRAVEYLKSK
ncbi:MAG: S41 family peptidase [Clostridia bacterium]|nr:S41 family peptidase [Clostridia bacterium]